MSTYGLHTLIHATHLVALGEARVALATNDLRGFRLRRDHEENYMIVLSSPRDLATRYHFSVHDDELLAHYQIGRVFQSQVVDGADDESLQWAERLMLEATKHYEMLANRGAKKTVPVAPSPHLKWPDLD